MAKISREFVQSVLEAGTTLIKDKVSLEKVSAFYNYLPNKEALVGILIEREADRHLKILETKYAEVKGQDFESIIDALLREIIRAMENGKTGIKIILTSTFAVERLEALLHARRSLVTFVEKVLRDAGYEPAIKANVIVAAMGGVVETIVFRRNDNISDEELIQETKKLVLSYVNS